jgi:hypothetical protein
MARFPIDDWQFWVVTAAAAVAAGWLLRGVLRAIVPERYRRRRGRGRRATLTVGGKPVDR